MSSWPANSSVAGLWPMATKTPSVRMLGDGAALEVAQADMGDGGRGVARRSISSTALSQTTSIFGCRNSRSCRMRSARKRVAPVHERHLRGEVGEIERLLDGGVAAADHDDLLAAEEEAVAGRAGRDAEALELRLRGQAEPLRLGAGGDDQRVAAIGVAGVAGEAERALAEVDLDDVVGDHAGADMLGLEAHLLHQPGALDDVGEARIVLDVGRDHQLAAGLEAGDQHRLEHGARGVDRGRVAGGSRADDDELGVVVGHFEGLSGPISRVRAG